MIERMDDFPDPLLPIKSTFLFFFRASIMAILGCQAPMPRSCGDGADQFGDSFDRLKAVVRTVIESRYSSFSIALEIGERVDKREGDKLQP